MIARNPNFDHHSRTQTCHGQNYLTLYTPFSDIAVSEGDLHWKWLVLSQDFCRGAFVAKRPGDVKAASARCSWGKKIPPIFAPKCWVDENKRDATVGSIMQETNVRMLAPSAFLLPSYTILLSDVNNAGFVGPPNRRLVGQAARSIDTASQMMAGKGNRP